MLVEFCIASRLGRVWLRLHPALNDRLGDGPDVCLLAATDRDIDPDVLWQAQEFAVRVWWRAAVASFLLFFPVEIAIAALLPRGSRIADWLTGGLGVLWAAVAMAALIQMMISRYRADQTARYVARGYVKPLDGYESGYPTRFDFAFGTGLAVIVGGLIGYAGLHSLF